MSNILFTDHPVCQLMAEKAMQDPEYKRLLNRVATQKEARRDLTIENDMTKFRHKLLMLSRIEHGSYQHHIGSLDLQKYGNKCALLSVGRAPSNSRRALTILAEHERLQANPKAFPLLRLPIEIRQQIYDKSVYAETIPTLYNSRVFDFGVDIFGIVPFLRKMTPLARESVHNIHMELYYLPTHLLKKPVFQHHQDVRGNAKDWTEACAYIADNLQLKKLSINVSTEVHEASQSPVDLSRLQWVKDLVQIQELQSLSYHISASGHGLKGLRPRVNAQAYAASSKWFSPGPDDIVDGDVKGARPDLRRLFEYLRGEMLEKSSKSDPCL